MSAATIVLDAIMIGIGATAIGDLWALFVRRVLGVPSPDWALVGRWVGHMPRGRFMHSPIAAAAPIRNERIVGRIVHYGIGIGFAAILLAIWGATWAERPTPGPALIVGLASIAAPFLIMQPAFGFGIAGSKLPNPPAARFKSLTTHLVFGLGLYLAALCWAALRFG